MHHRPFPLEPLARAAGATSIHGGADRFGVSARTIARWRKSGLSEIRADELACLVGKHPAEVWGPEWWDA